MLPGNSAPKEPSLIGKLARLCLLLIACPLVVWYAFFPLNQLEVILGLVALAVLILSQITTRGNQLLRIVLLVTMTANVVVLPVNALNVIGGGDEVPGGIPVYVLALALAVASLIEICKWASCSSRATLLKAMAWGSLTIPAISYVVGIPLLQLVSTSFESGPKEPALSNSDWNFANEASFRAAKFAVFAVFTYLGACLGSFLNVVSYSVPRGKAIGLRDSRCPKCGTAISRTDNLPIFSYINLKAKCRSCSASIPARYLIVELVVAGIFGSLFLYELVTGCANVPLMRITHTGILWIILYPKWPAIAIYFFHAFFMCAVLVISLVEWDRLSLGWIDYFVIGLLFFVPAAIYDPIQPVPLTEHVPGALFSLPPWLEQIARLAVGAVIGAILGRLSGIAFSSGHSSTLTFAFLLTGLVLGWQAALHVALLFGFLAILAHFLPWRNGLRGRPTTILFTAIVIHHPFWKTVADWWRFN